MFTICWAIKLDYKNKVFYFKKIGFVGLKMFPTAWIATALYKTGGCDWSIKNNSITNHC